jgi:HK97 family phage major capsid protein
MSKVLELREKRAKIWNTAKDFLEHNRDEKGLVTADAEAQYEKMENEMVALGREIERLERQNAYDLEFEKSTTAIITNKPTTAEHKTGRESNEYRADFANVLRGKQQVNNVLSTSPDADGGYLVPVEFEKRILTGLNEANVVRKIAKVIKTSAERKIPIAADQSVAQWTPENAPYQESKLTFSQKTIDAFKLTDLVKISMELMQDSMFDLESYIADEFARAFGVAEEEAFCVGTGKGQPSGIFTAEGGTVGATATKDITTDCLIDLVYSLKSPYRRNAKFLMNDKTVSAIRKLKDANGAYLWQPSIQAGEPDRLLGYAIYTSPYAPLATAGQLAIAFGDFSHYWIADRMGRSVQRLNELYAGTGQVGFIATQRVDGKVIHNEGIKLLKMGGTAPASGS